MNSDHDTQKLVLFVKRMKFNQKFFLILISLDQNLGKVDFLQVRCLSSSSMRAYPTLQSGVLPGEGPAEIVSLPAS